MNELDEVKAIKIRGQSHRIKHHTMAGYKTVCGKTASFGHSVYWIHRDELDCPICRAEPKTKDHRFER